MHSMILNQWPFSPIIIKVQVNGYGIGGLDIHNRRWFIFYIKISALVLLVGIRIILFVIVVKLENHVVCHLFLLEIVQLNLFQLFILICGDPMSHDWYRYYVIFIDECTRFTWFYPLRRKFDFFHCFLTFQSMVERQFD